MACNKRGRPWSPEEDAELPGRSLHSLYVRSKKFGLRRQFKSDVWHYDASVARIRDLSETQVAYIAGIFDGEGCIKKRNKGRRGYDLRIANTCRDLHDWLVQVVGGIVHYRTQKAGYKQCGFWILHRRIAVVAFLMRLRPYLIVKAKEVDAALADTYMALLASLITDEFVARCRTTGTSLRAKKGGNNG